MPDTAQSPNSDSPDLAPCGGSLHAIHHAWQPEPPRPWSQGSSPATGIAPFLPNNSSQASTEITKSQLPLYLRFAGVSSFCSCPGSQVYLTGSYLSPSTQFSPGRVGQIPLALPSKWNVCICVGQGLELGGFQVPPKTPSCDPVWSDIVLILGPWPP